MPKQDENIEIEKDILLGLYRKREYGILSAVDSNELKNRKAKVKKLENELKVVSFVTEKKPR